MNITNGITNLLNIKYPIISGGMVWVSGWRLASAVSESGGLGLIGAGSMKPELLQEHIKKCFNNTNKPFGVNLPLLRGDAEELLNVIINEGVKVVFTSAGNPAKFIEKLKSNNCTVVHVVPSVKHAKKAESVGCDAIVAEGVEAGGHNGADEITTLSLIPQIKQSVSIPVIAAGGITNGNQIAAALCLGADGVQMGTRFAATVESSAHENYKQAIINASDTSTTLVLKKLGMARMLKNEFSTRAIEAEYKGASIDELREILGAKRERLGIFEGDSQEGMMEVGQGVGLIHTIPSVSELFSNIISEFDLTINKVKDYK